MMRSRWPEERRPFDPALLPVLWELVPAPPVPPAPARPTWPWLLAGLGGYWLLRLLLGRYRALPGKFLRFESGLAAGLLLLSAVAAAADNRWFEQANPLLLLGLGVLVFFPAGNPAVYLTVPAALALAAWQGFGVPAWGVALLLLPALPGIGALWRRGRGGGAWWGFAGALAAAALATAFPAAGPLAVLAALLLLPPVCRL